MLSSRIFIALLAVFVYLQAPAVTAETESPTEQLKPTLEKLVDILSDPSLEGQENKKKRRDLIMSTISKRFDFREMSKRVLGPTWREISPEERDNFTAEMTKLLENNYIGQLENYSGETVEYVGERVREDRAQVSTLIESEGSQYPVHYIMNREDGKWMVYDINIEGVSLIRNYRAEFKSILRRQNYEGLIKTLEKKNASFEQS